MIQRIMVPVDGSRFAEIALPVAIDLAKRTTGTVRLVRAYEPWSTIIPPPQAIVLLDEPDRSLRDAEGQYLTDLVNRIAPNSPVPITSTLIDGLAGPVLVEQSQSRHTDLVVMTTHGRGSLSRFWLGSVADYAIRHTSTPILLLRPKDDVDWAAGNRGFRRILVATDFSPTADVILEPVAEMAKLFGSDIELTNVVAPALGYATASIAYPVPALAEIDETTRRIAHEELDQRARLLREKGLTVTTTVLFGTGAAAVLLDRVRGTAVDLVAIATHGRTGWRRAVIGSVADKLIRGVGGALLVVGAPATPAEASPPGLQVEVAMR